MASQEGHVPSGMDSFPSDDLDLGARFLLVDFEQVRRFKEQSVNIADRRIDVYMALASAIGAGLVVLSRLHTPTHTFLTMALISQAILLIVGISTVHTVIDRDILIVDYIRAGNRIRAYFAERAPHIRQYLLMPCAHDFPPYGWQSSNRQIALVGNALVGGVITSIVSLLISRSSAVDESALVPGTAVAVAIYSLQWFYAALSYRRAEAQAKAKLSVSLFGSHQGLSQR